jgi:release factor glutamine methyltransferase
VTLHEAIVGARVRLMASRISAEEAAVDVDLFARTILGWDRAQIITAHASPIPSGLEPRFSEWLTRRARYEPSAYIVGVKEFWGLDFCVTPAVLIPRPETEMIVEEVLRLYRGGEPGGPGARIADVGTGSGCIAVSIAHALPGCRMVATDVSTEALAVASENSVRHGVADRVELVATSYLDGVAGMFDAIAANPPYVRELDKVALGAEVRHEPEVALFGGDNGLRHIEGVLATAVSKLLPGGWLVMEFGAGQDDQVEALVARQPALRLEAIRGDLQGIPRTAVIERGRD